MAFQIENVLTAAKLGCFAFEGVTVVNRNEALWQAIQGVVGNLRKKYATVEVGQIERVRAVRELFKAAGMDPSRYRPSSEALFRRILKGQDLYQINSVVDVNNWCSLEFLLPMGVYDAANVTGAKLTFRVGRAGELYQGIGKEIQNAEGKIIMADEEKICGGPVADSVQTMVTLHTKTVLMVIYAPQGTDRSDLGIITEACIRRMTTYNGGKLTFKSLV